eukprot:GILK01009042.1.p1 GENE.GILK01009042.1~~GILK01009042.1.p1  ORF type:complete len:386 (-),score=22.72 GILK01009042.1:280-1437(-)
MNVAGYSTPLHDIVANNHLTRSKVHRPSRQGDWICQSCSNRNFAFRDVCNRCQKRKDSDSSVAPPLSPSSRFTTRKGQALSFNFGSDVSDAVLLGKPQRSESEDLVLERGREGNWRCTVCDNINFAFRGFCNRCKQPQNVFETATVRTSVSLSMPNLESRFFELAEDRSVPIQMNGLHNHSANRGRTRHDSYDAMEFGFMDHDIQTMEDATYMNDYDMTAVTHNGHQPEATSMNLPDHISLSFLDDVSPTDLLPPHSIQRHVSAPAPNTAATAAPGTATATGTATARLRWRDGDWTCGFCGNHNYAMRPHCNRCQKDRKQADPLQVPVVQKTKDKSALEKEKERLRTPKFIARPGDWVCSNCKNVNYSFRERCNRCQGSARLHSI